MKKFIALATLLFAFSLSANAQDNKQAVQEAAKNDSKVLAELLSLNPTQTDDFTRLFEMKHEALMSKEASMERKKETMRIVEAKLRASLDAYQIQKIEASPELTKRFFKL